VHVGVIMRPDLELLKEAFARARAREPQLRLVLLGNTSRPAAELQAPGIEATGRVSESVLRQWVAAADAGVLPMLDTVGHRGRWPAKLSDYMSGGIPTIVTDVGDVADLVRSHGIGWVAAAEPRALADAMGAALAATDRTARGAAAARLAAGPLSWRSVAADVETFYLQVTRQWKAAA
jgi:glycosyltransferase involved in cell wall biosynthesis